MKLTSYGAAEGVTGSCHLLEVGQKRILLDCGIFQGSGSTEQNEPPLPFDPSTIDALLVSHAHLDHIGRIPLLMKEGFQGRIISNRPTLDLARLSLMDSARIMDSDARRFNRKRRAGEPEREALYDEDDVFNALEHWQGHAQYHQQFEVCEGVKATLYDAGHILGSTFIHLELDDGKDQRTMIFSGDLGNTNKPIIRDPETPPKADFVLMESTYGDRDHRPFDQTVEELEEAVNYTLGQGGNVLIPAFALERSQELLYVLYEAWRAGRIPHDVRIFLDSPMAIDATKIFARHPGCYDEHAIEMTEDGGNPFHFDALVYSRHTNDSKRINNHKSGAIIIAGSGMCTGGRILHHLIQNLPRKECGVIFCGYQGHGTLGRRIIEGQDQIRIHGSHVDVRAHVHTINGFSGHAGQDTLTQWAKATEAKKIVLVHGELDVRARFAEHLKAQTNTPEIINQSFGTAITL